MNRQRYRDFARSVIESGRIDKHLRDIAAMLTVQGDDLDSDYIEQWAARIGATDLWHALVGEYHRRIRAQATPE